MKNTPSSLPPALGLVLALGLAITGQFFIIQQNISWTLYPAILSYGLALVFFLKTLGPSEKEKTLSRSSEIIALILISLVALFFRLYKLSEFPAGIFTDEACEGWGALRILREGWRPFYDIYHLLVWDPPLYYLLALWFKFVSVSQVHFFLFSVFFSLLSFPLIYWTFRQLAGSRTALLTLFILAVMRWDITYSRDCHPAIQVLFYMFGTLSFWTYAFKTKKGWAFWVGAVFFGLGFYVYQAYKAFLILMVFYAAYELTQPKQKETFFKWRIVEFFGVATALATPLLVFLARSGNVGERESELFIFPGILKGGNPLPLIHHFLATCLMFNREGDGWFVHNLPGHRMLDDVTGIFFVLGFFMALSQAMERKFFYVLTGVGVMCLPAFLSLNPTHASRAFGAIPFVAFLAAHALSRLSQKVGSLKFPTASKISILVLAVLLVFMSFGNYWVYFQRQAKDYSCWRYPSTDETAVGNAILRNGDSCEYFLSPRFFGHYTVLFLGFAQKEHMHRLDIPEALVAAGIPQDRDLFFALEEGQSGRLDLLRDLYPGGTLELLKDPQNHTIVYFYRVQAKGIVMSRDNASKFLRSRFGLTGTYILSPDQASPVTYLHQDAILNFTSRPDFPPSQFSAASLTVHWTGKLWTKVSGSYRFLTLTTDEATLTLDGKPLLDQGNVESKDIFLKPGLHKIRVSFGKTTGINAAFNLLWKVPGQAKFKVVPYTAFKGP